MYTGWLATTMWRGPADPADPVDRGDRDPLVQPATITAAPPAPCCRNERRVRVGGMIASVSDFQELAKHQELAKQHLWLHFARMGGYRPASGGTGTAGDVPVFVR